MMNKTNSERYKESFDKLHLSEDFGARFEKRLEKEREDIKVSNIRTFGIGRIAAVAAVFTLVFASACYAADLGGIRTTIQMWINGKSESIEVTDMGDGAMTWTDENGENHGLGGYIVTDGEEGSVMSAQEMASYMNNSAELEFKDDRIIFHYHNISEDVTDLVGPDKKLHVHVDDPANPNTYFDFSQIGEGTYSMECGKSAAEDTDYHEADAKDLISGDPVEALDDDAGVTFTTQVTE